MIPKILGAQRDFSAGELDEAMKRADEMPALKSGARQMVNLRVLSGGQAQNRPGRRALFLEPGRVEEVLMSPGNVFFLAFGNGYVAVYNAAGTQVAISHTKGDGSTPIPWTVATASSITFAVVPAAQPQVVIAYGHDFPNNVPQVLTWDGVSQSSNWTLSTFAESVLGTGQKRTIFDRLSKANVTILPSGITGTVSFIASAPVFEPGMVGARMLWCGRQVVISQFVGVEEVLVNVVEQLPNAVGVVLGTFVDVGNGNQAFLPGGTGNFIPGDLVEGATSGARGIVITSLQELVLAGTAQNPFFAEGTVVIIQVIPTSTNQNPIPYYLATTVGFTQYFLQQEFLVGANGNGQVGNSQLQAPQPVAVWDDEVMNNFRGWPKSVFYDQNRLGFCNFGVQTNAIAWSSNGLTSDFYVNGLATSANADNAIYEKAPSGTVQFVVPGMESSEFVFCDNAIYYIPITAQLPLTPGSVSFNLLTTQGNFPNIKPQQVQQSILYVRAGGASLGAVQTPGYYFRPNVIDIVSELHSHLFTAVAPVALAVPQAPAQFEENYAYLLRADGTIVTAKYLMRNGLLEPGPEGKPKMGWLQWNGLGSVNWISAQGADLIFSTSYDVVGNPWSSGFSNGFDGGKGQSVQIIEALDNTEWLDASILVNAAPAPFAPPGGKGPLWFLAGQEVFLIDLGTRFMGVYQIDVNGNIVPQFQAGENLSSTQLVAGQAWTAMLEPFVPDAPPAQSIQQRMKRRRVSRVAVYVSNSSGFLFAKLFSGPITPTSPPLGTEMNTYRIPTWNQGDNAALPPPLREEAYRWRPSGRAFDPRVAIVKDTPGPLLIHEIGFEVTV